ncbi:aminotransferase class V-fold PLP-dependent enzyme [bacterium]|nr:aminotransferase class V-fold PLP-dependent enzyme [bacterium]
MKNFLTGPTAVSPEVLAQLASPIFGHHTSEFKALAKELKRGLNLLFDTNGSVFPFTCSVSAALEATLHNVVVEKLLVLSNGAFGERWAWAARASGLSVCHLHADLGEIFDPQAVQRMIEKHHPDTLVMVHGETSTGMLNVIDPIADLLVDYPNILLVIDAVGTIGGVPLSMKTNRIDVLIGASQKCLALPPGIVPVGVSERALQRSESSSRKGYAFNFGLWQEKWQKGETVATPAIPQLKAMAFQLQRIAEEGLTHRWQRHQTLLEMTTKWAATNGFRPFAPCHVLLPSVSCLMPDAKGATQPLVDRLRERGYLIDAGYDKLKNQCLRIGHLGDWRQADLEVLLRTIEDVL